MVHIYYGEGKGKTTAAMGLALRAAGRGWRVLIVQFLKGSDTGERKALAALTGVTLLPVPARVKFSFQMGEAERREAAERFEKLCSACETWMGAGPGLVILDEACTAAATGLLPLERLLKLLSGAGAGTEMVLTGRQAHPALLERADYVTEMKCVRHPYQKGIRAREGIEY